ncbi:MAG: peptidylprolyl isomerase [Verrucomicrobiales bacterium]|nr:peptidylprolyl isomerase [Verrucomicrobiales bacterium]
MSTGAAPSRARFPWRALLYTLVIAYLVADLYWIEGPLKQRLERNRAFTKFSLQRALANRWVATVNGEPLTRAQLDQAAAVHFFRQGRDPASLSPAAVAIGRRVALWHLIEDALVRKYCDSEAYQVDPAAVDRRVAEFKARFSDPATLSARLDAMGLNENSLADELREQERQRQWLEARIAEAAAVTDADLREWYDANAAADPGTENPPLIRARHLFLSTVLEDTPEREARIREAHRLLVSGETDFATLAADLSEDERTRRDRGDLGWFGPSRMPRDFADIAFGLRPGQVSEPFRTSLGWHIVEVTDTREPERLDFEALKPEIRAWLETERRRYAVQVFINRLKTVGVVEVFPDNF